MSHTFTIYSHDGSKKIKADYMDVKNESGSPVALLINAVGAGKTIVAAIPLTDGRIVVRDDGEVESNHLDQN